MGSPEETAIEYLDEFIDRYREYLNSLPKNKPPRSIDKYLSALRLKLEFTKAKPAQKIESENRTKLTSEHRIVFVQPDDGSRVSAETQAAIPPGAL